MLGCWDETLQLVLFEQREFEFMGGASGGMILRWFYILGPFFLTLSAVEWCGCVVVGVVSLRAPCLFVFLGVSGFYTRFPVSGVLAAAVGREEGCRRLLTVYGWRRVNSGYVTRRASEV